MKDRPDPSHLRSRAFTLLAVLAPALGGSTEPWARGSLLLATAAALLVWPPRRTPGGGWLALAAALLPLPLLALLPAGWFPPAAWRDFLVENFYVNLPSTASAQPWLTAEGAGQFFAGIVFALALAAHGWRSSQRREAANRYALGILILAGLAVVALLARWHVPGWPHTPYRGFDFGFFPNRNQTANVLALAGIMMTALAWETLHRHRSRGYAWFAGLMLIGVALVIDYSRAGIAIFLGGAVLWVLLSMRFSASKKGATLAFAGVLVLLTAFLLFGGETLQRFQHRTETATRDYRIQVQQDAWWLAAQRPWLGQGLGNFEPVFAVTRHPTLRQDRALHPESDWMWTAVELGWPAVALLAAALGLWAWRLFPFDSGSDRYLRSAAAVCGVAFALHGLVDVSGHRAGALWPALFLFSLALHPRRMGGERAWVAPLFRAGAAVMALLGAWWLSAAIWPQKTLATPTSATVAWLEAQTEAQNSAGDHAAALAFADAALDIAPLHWWLYYQRGVAKAGVDQREAAVADFMTARFLEPRWIELTRGEAELWLKLDEPILTLNAWAETLLRAGPDAPAFFEQMITASWKHPSLHAGLARLAEAAPALLIVYLERTERLEFDALLAALLERDPELKTLEAAHRRRLFATIYRHGEGEELIRLIVAHPEWQEDAWEWVARYYANEGDFARAWRFVQRYETPPALPSLGSASSVAELEREFHFHPENLQAGLELYASLRKLRQTEEALTTLSAVDALPGRPAYVPWLLAELWAEKGEAQKAWAAWERYREARRK